ncbi:hypothetical protein [Sideroxydans lithotrophicus]|uniref:Uncharacterized protein n=1 Tax=Sideroxydans lithotrophicus (strain ES-1) TaxID=580332 RepID=D5CT82_SIDLE|nr:hypothetical protein [Sideroxydans lithotrophicus]ADE12168.1 hypothetical protein Slit_1939 [Sideroxydans lithotrophicus ES-1]
MKLFYDDEFEAISLAISSSNKTFKQVASFIFPDMKPESAYSRLKTCCSPTGDQRLTFGQTLRVMAFCESYDALMYACDELSHARPIRVAPKDEEVRLVDAIKGASETLNKAMQQLERIQRANIKAAA